MCRSPGSVRSAAGILVAAGLALSVPAFSAPAFSVPIGGAPARAASAAMATAASATGGDERGAYEWNSATWWPSPSSYAGTLTRLKGLGVTTLYVDITGAVSLETSHSSSLASYLSDFEQLVRSADADGLRVDAVGGDPHWATSDRKGPALLLSAVTQITAALGAGVLDGVQFDVEPWALGGWHAHRVAYATDWLRFVQSVVTTWTGDGLSGRLGFTVPYWFDGATGGVPEVSWAGSTGYPFQLALGLLGPVGASVLNVMAYRNQTSGPNGSLALFASNVAAVASAHSPTELLAGQETGPASPAEVTFYGTNCSSFEAAAGQITATFSGDASYAGIAVDDVESLEALCPG